MRQVTAIQKRVLTPVVRSAQLRRGEADTARARA
jgi:hypothetical protein